jgi:hypothetical protein
MERAGMVAAALAAALALAAVAVFVWYARRRARIAAARARAARDARMRRELALKRAEAARQARQDVHAIPTAKLRALAHFAHHGAYGGYTGDGAWLPGIEPDAARATRAYEELLRRGDETVLLEYARLCHHGPPGHEGVLDADRALRLYHRLLARTADLHEKYDLMEHVVDLAPPGPPRAQAQAARSRLAAAIAQERLDAAVAAARAPPAAVPPAAAAARAALARAGARAGPPARPPPGPRPPRNDTQNAHDGGVTRTLAVSIDNLRRAVGGPAPGAGEAVRRLIAEAPVSDDKRARAVEALDAIERNDTPLDGLGNTETAVLGLVWARIHHPDNADNAANLRENLVDELADAVERGTTVCARGRYARVLNSLSGVDDAVDIRPQWAISQEMVAKAGAVYAERVAALPDEDRRAVEAVDATPEQRDTARRVTDGIKAGVMEALERDYVTPGIMSREDLEVETARWIDHIA